jgi:Na+-transporting NADH:ubiquinone oxidoreductase subunit NqrC
MRKRGFTAVALSAALFSINVSSAVADPTPSPSIDSFKAAQEQFRKDRDAYMLALRDRDIKMRAINTTFKSAVDKSTTDAKTAMSAATTPEQKNSITAARRTAVATAIVARESAIAALGPLPTPPVEPQRPAKMAPQGMSDQKGKQKR